MSENNYQLSSSTTFFFKYAMRYSFYLISAIGVVISFLYKEWAVIAFLGCFLIIVQLCYWIQFSNTADKVIDMGNSIYIRKGKIEMNIPFSNIDKVDWIWNTLPATLHFKEITPFGKRLMFVAKMKIGGYKMHQSIYTLKGKINGKSVNYLSEYE